MARRAVRLAELASVLQDASSQAELEHPGQAGAFRFLLVVSDISKSHEL